MYEPISRIFHFLLFAIFIGAVGSSAYFLNLDTPVAPSIMVVPSPAPANRPAVNPTPEPGWTLVQPGLEKRVFEIYDNQGQHVESVHVWRLAQDYFRLDVAVDERPKSLAAWQAETGAALVVNGGYYSIENERYFPDGQTIINGVARGRSLGSRAGMLAIHERGAELRSLALSSYDPSESLRAALQSFPVLVQPGGQPGVRPGTVSPAPARRTVIAQDRAGRILFIVAPQGYFTLHELSVYLTESNLDLDIAINLDGGGSTGILVADPQELIAPTRPLPFVILAYPR
jgi:hypothetical protein